MLDDCRNAMPQEQFFPKETGRSMDQFQSDFFAWCDKQIAGWGYDAETSKKYADLREEAEGLLKDATMRSRPRNGNRSKRFARSMPFPTSAWLEFTYPRKPTIRRRQSSSWQFSRRWS